MTGFQTSRETFEEAVYSHFNDFVHFVYEKEEDERKARKYLFHPLEEFMCQGDPEQVFQQLHHSDEPSQLCGHNFKNGEPTYSCR